MEILHLQRNLTVFLLVVLLLSSFSDGSKQKLMQRIYRRRLVRRIPTKGSTSQLIITNDGEVVKQGTKKPLTEEELPLKNDSK